MSDLKPVFGALRSVMAPYGSRLAVKRDTGDEYYVESANAASNGKPEFFGAVQIKKGYVSYHLMPVYTHPELLDGLSSGLKARMQGKSCFNFKGIDPALFDELSTLTKRGYAVFEAQR
ncbi:hypothetical protein [Novilysobacter spongiicola]|uniref:DUF1801 domain-containing protein n=1 Tax=Lysobacter spongiicola DSM 21749 TaxID=1122188 RepID=A0A1T4RBG4_9GAMM|nr:hypothetical protein [Lysobacter spongiicola]SKA13390.1 hypothetical protein SAMN02745674_02067 [Lysobacter spongiicola DSM 21749]